MRMLRRLLLVAGGLVLQSAGVAQEATPTVTASEGVQVVQHTFDVDTPPNGTLYDQLPQAEKELVDSLEEWAVAVHSPDVHNAYAAYAAQVNVQAQVERAAVISGLDGIADAGVQ